MPRYRQVEETVHALIANAFSGAVIEPGKTTTEDVEWWLRQRVQELGMTVWFHPDVERAAADSDWDKGVIQRGDALWVDFGVIAMDLHTDTQHLVYVLQEGVPGRGELRLRPATWFSIELQATSAIPEWDGRRLACRQEEEAYLDDEGERHWTYRRQERFHLVR